MNGRWLIIAMILVGGWGFLELILHQMKIGDYAQSPQHFELAKGAKVFVGGGKARVTFLDAPFLKSAQLQVSCKGTDERFQLRPSKQTGEICGIRIQFIEFVPGGKVALKVSWGDDPVSAESGRGESAPTQATPPKATSPKAPDSQVEPITEPPEGATEPHDH